MAEAAPPRALEGPKPGNAGRGDPAIRLLGWLALCVAFVVARPERPAEAWAVLAGTALWLGADHALHPRPRGGPPLKVTLWLFVLTVSLALLAASGGARGGPPPWIPVLFRAAGCATLSTGLARGLTAAELLEVLGAFPSPAPIRRGLEWTLRSLPLLVAETRDVGRAVVVRKGRSGLSSALALARALPRVWLPRVLGRADRLASAMLLRGYQGEPLAPGRVAREAGGRERIPAAAAAVTVSATVVLRWLFP